MSQSHHTVLPTSWKDPDLEHATSATYKRVYEPSEDTFLMMEALEKQASYFHKALPDDIECLEIGAGTGILSAYLHRILTSLPRSTPLSKNVSNMPSGSGSGAGNKSANMTAVDINPDAISVSKETFARNAVTGDVVLSDLASNVKDKLMKRVNVILFNHPYVPCPKDELENADMHARSYAGGIKGREVLDRFISQIPDLLSPHPGSAFYVVVLHPGNDIVELNELLASQAGLTQSGIVTARKEGIECLAIVRYTRGDIASSNEEYKNEEGFVLEQATPEGITSMIKSSTGTHLASPNIPSVVSYSNAQTSSNNSKSELETNYELKNEVIDEENNDSEDEMRNFWK